eukprot:UN28137
MNADSLSEENYECIVSKGNLGFENKLQNIEKDLILLIDDSQGRNLIEQWCGHLGGEIYTVHEPPCREEYGGCAHICLTNGKYDIMQYFHFGIIGEIDHRGHALDVGEAINFDERLTDVLIPSLKFQTNDTNRTYRTKLISFHSGLWDLWNFGHFQVHWITDDYVVKIRKFYNELESLFPEATIFIRTTPTVGKKPEFVLKEAGKGFSNKQIESTNDG